MLGKTSNNFMRIPRAAWTLLIASSMVVTIQYQQALILYDYGQ